jgi:predicted anti-sigma-YlaC factor YlaD
MNITRDVVTDLLPLYFAGEASPDTRALLEEYLQQNPAFAAAVRTQAERSVAMLADVVASPPLTAEKAAFERVRRYNRSRHLLLAFTMSFALMPFAFVFHNREVQWLMVRDSPTQAIYFLVASAGCGIAYYCVGRRVRKGTDPRNEATK